MLQLPFPYRDFGAAQPSILVYKNSYPADCDEKRFANHKRLRYTNKITRDDAHLLPTSYIGNTTL